MSAAHARGADALRPDGHNVEVVHALLRRAILDGQLAGREELSQVRLAGEYGVSRTVLREALRLLQREGLIEQSEPNRRVRIAGFSVEDMEQIYAARVGLESLGIRLSVPRFSSEDLAELDAELAKMAHFARHKQYDRWQEPHRNLHRGFVKHAGKRIRSLLEELSDHAERYRRYYTVDAPDAWSFGVVEHQAIVEACKAGDANEAAEALVAHLAHTVFSVIEMVAPGYDPALLRDAVDSMTAELRANGSAAAAGDASSTIGEGVGLTRLDELEPFALGSAAGERPSLPPRLSLANVDSMNIYSLFAQGMRQACQDRGLTFAEVNAHGDPAKNAAQVQTFLQRGTGGLAMIPLGLQTQTPVMREALRAGCAVFGLSSAPATCQLLAHQYEVGKTHGAAAATWIREHLGGKAKVAYFNLDAVFPTLVPRHTGVMDALRALGGGVTLVDQGLGAGELTPGGGFKLVSSLLQAHPDINVIMGPDAFVLGAAKAVTATRNRTVRYISGVDGDAPVVTQVQRGGLMKATVGFPWKLWGYAAAQFTADWLEGKSIPQAIVAEGVLLDSPAAIEAFQAKQADPATYWKTDHVAFLGSISYETRHRWLRSSLRTDPAG
jgi:ribose transport system substrate-binding protein